MKRTVTTVVACGLMLTTALSTAQAAELRVSWWGGDSRHEATQEALQICADKYGHTINPEYTGYDGHLERLTTQLAGGTEPDLMQVNWPWLPLFSPDGTGLADLNDYADIIDLSQWSDELLATGTRNGHLNGLPVSITGRLLFVNAGTFEAAGVEVPTTWDGMREVAATFKTELGEQYYPFDAATYNAMLFTALYASQKTGVGFIDPETNEIAWDVATLTEAIEAYQSLVDAGAIKAWEDIAAMGSPTLQERGDWAAGEVASSYEWNSTFAKISAPFEGESPLVPYMPPKVDGAVSDGIFRKPSMTFAISANSENPEAAAEILNCLLVEEEGVIPMGTQRAIPASQAAVEILEREGLLSSVELDANRMVLAADAPAPSPYFEDPGVRSTYEGVMEEFAYGLLTAEEAAQAIIDGSAAAIERATD